MGPENVSWRALIILKSVQKMNLVKPLVLMDPSKIDICLPAFLSKAFQSVELF